MGRTRVLVADDHRAVADVLSIRLGAEPDIEVIGIANSATDAEAMTRELRPDVVLLDIEFGDGNGVAVARRLASEELGVRVVVVTVHDDEATVREAVRAGVTNFVVKDASSGDLLRAVRGATRGQAWIDPRVLRGLLDQLAGPDPAMLAQEKLAVLTEREREVLDCMVRGCSRTETARELFLSVNTVRTHCRNLLAKLGVRSTLEAVSIATRAGSHAHGLG